MRMRTTQPFPLPTPFIFSLAADVTGSSTQCRSLRFTHPTHAAAGAASHRRSEDKLRVYFSVFLPRFLGFLFLPRNELSGGPPPAHPDTHTHTSPPPPYTQTRTHSHTHTLTHRRLLCKRRRRRCCCSFFLSRCCWTSWTIPGGGMVVC